MNSDHTARIGGRKAPAIADQRPHDSIRPAAWRGRGGGRIPLVVHRASRGAAAEGQTWILLFTVGRQGSFNRALIVATKRLVLYRQFRAF